MEHGETDEITLCLTADICNAIFDEHRNKRRWDTIISAGLRLEETFACILDDFGSSPMITWFIRADPGMRKCFGSAAFLFKRYDAYLSKLSAKGHEIGWHPHLDIRNLKHEVNELPAIAKRVRDFFPVSSVRIGEGFHSSELMDLMMKLDFTADSTALPGRFNLECRTPFDWRSSPEYPYFPDGNNYRHEFENLNSGILEIPFTMLPIRLPQDQPGPASRYMNFSYHRHYFQSGVMAKKNWQSVLVGITHPAEIAPPGNYSKQHKLLSLNEREPVENVSFLIERLRSLGMKIKYRSIHETEILIRKRLPLQTWQDHELEVRISKE